MLATGSGLVKGVPPYSYDVPRSVTLRQAAGLVQVELPGPDTSGEGLPLGAGKPVNGSAALHVSIVPRLVSRDSGRDRTARWLG